MDIPTVPPPQPPWNIADRLKTVREEVDARRLRHEFDCLYGTLLLDEAHSRRTGADFTLGGFLDDAGRSGWRDASFLGITTLGRHALRRVRYERMERIGDDLGKQAQQRADALMAQLKQFSSLGKAMALRSVYEEELPQFNRADPQMFVCSDVHLGVNRSDREAFEQGISLCDSGDTLLLLGDILDFWVSDPNQAIVRGQPAIYWEWLHQHLQVLHDRGVSIRYVPGNHDPFVFTLYSASASEWGADLRRRAPFFQEFEAAVASRWPLTRVATIHYPFFPAHINGESWLFTHGHIHEWRWALLGSDDATDDVHAMKVLRAEIPWGFGWLSSVASEMAYKHQSVLRAAFKALHNLRHPRRWLGDVSMLITHEVLRSQNIAAELRTRDWTAAHSKIESAFELFSAMTSQQVELRNNVLKGFEALEEYRLDMHEQKAREETRKWISKYPQDLNYQFESAAPRSDKVHISETEIGTFRDFEPFVCGHFHRPTTPSNIKPTCVDVGAMYEGVVTMIQINQNTGWIGRPAGIEATA